MVVIDTNIILLGASNILHLGTPVIIPETVIDEVDSKKSIIGNLGYQAREFGRIITRATNRSVTKRGSLIETSMQVDDVTIIIASLDSAYPDFSDTSSSIINDRKIIFIAQAYPDATFISNDVMARIRAESLGLRTSDFKLVEDVDPSFLVELEIPTLDQFSSLDNSDIYSINPDHKPENYNYRFTCPHTTQVKLGIVKQNNLLDVIGKKQETDLHQQHIAPSNSEQLLLSAAIQDPTIDLIVIDSPAGTGKTATAISNAIAMVGRNSPYESITYIRASIDDVDDVEAVGFLSGNDEKFAVYLHPLFDTLDFIARKQHSQSKLRGEEYEKFIQEKITEYQSKYNITAMTGLGMRGRTFSNTIAIIDECQGQSKASLQKMLTRFGKNSKVILCGSNNQIDNKYVTKYTNGLSVLLNEATKAHDLIRMHVVPLTKVVRSAIAEFAESIFTRSK